MFFPLVLQLEDRLAPRAGDLDLGFGTQGVTHLTQLTSIREAVALTDGRVVAVGGVAEATIFPDRSGDFGVVRLTASGQPDPTFGIDGFTRVSFNLMTGGTGNDVAYRVAAFADGSGYVVVGLADTPSAGYFDGLTDGIAVAVLTADGRLNPKFDTDGMIAFQFVRGRPASRRRSPSVRTGRSWSAACRRTSTAPGRRP
ncbi:NHL repeat-containing protein [Limnoglobus roseus]|uniref:Uncharacterized protein n=1 Tax=Limnoglobus roseus TaxID=2598579 RepID=A0A5C1AMU4_9BACT|nr:hypothetical protein [Limnoglobus roseus]QEL19895.1 hypothetical protein PX52LOC_06977 [Limnoglobus roseus]